MEEKRIDVVKKWPEPQLVQDIQVFIGFANFYRRFIKGFSRIATPLTTMLKTTGSSITSASRVDDNEIVGGGGAVGRSDASRKSAKSKSRSKSGHLDNSNNSEERKFLTFDAREAFNHLRQVFTKAPIRRHFNPGCHIRIETNASGYAIRGVLSQLTSNQVISDGTIRSNVDWHPVTYFSRKMIPVETRYETHDGELLAIVEAFKTWRHYLEGCKHEVLVLTDHNNLCRFMDTKSLSSRQVRWAQELSRYHFRIDYRQGKSNGAANALSQYRQRSPEEENTLHSKNVKILHRLQSSLTKVSGLSTSQLSPLHQVLICGTTMLPQLRYFWDSLQSDIAYDGPYASIGGMNLRLPELQNNNKEAKVLRARDLPKGWEEVERVL